MNSLIKNKTWTLEELPFGRKLIKCKWVFVIKTKPNGSLDRFKARLVAKGCSQKYGVDFHETYSPTMKYDSIRIVLAIATQDDMDIRQFDIKRTFLHGDLEEEAYMIKFLVLKIKKILRKFVTFTAHYIVFGRHQGHSMIKSTFSWLRMS
jgi:hypothetical protein